MRLAIYVLAAVVGVAQLARADESVTVETPIAPQGDTVARYVVGELVLRRFEPRYIEATVVGVKANGEFARSASGDFIRVTHRWTDPQATTMLDQLNTANLTNNSLARRVLVRLQSDGIIPAGTIGGTPGVPPAPLTPVPGP
ncbi:MAG: hypothetical protein AB7U73_23150 [Pirellulales bacterium]|uniref:hypothetical protein n=1 Tax=Bradyrhizobium sp. TaxID=376 RepID=UPI003D0F65F1